MQSPYQGLPARSFWRTGVSEQDPRTITGLYRKRFQLTPDMRVATGGSCFAQHISRYLRTRGFNVMDTEPAPARLRPDDATKWGYRLYSARYGNIYLVRQLLQLAQEAFGQFVPANAVWEKDGRYYDALRPSVEPSGHASPDAVAIHRQSHLRHVRRMFTDADVFVFTFGLTEGWVHRESGTAYPTAPGTIAGSFDADVYAFKNFTSAEILEDFIKFRALVKEHNPNLRFILTVSPVPLTATASDDHVLVATTYSKSVLRAVAGELYGEFSDVDYFPSYEMIASPFSRAAFYEANLRSVSEEGVEAVMRVFFQEHGEGDQSVEQPAAGAAGTVARATDEAGATAMTFRESRQEIREMRRQKQARRLRRQQANGGASNVVCEEILTDAFSR